MSTPTRSLAVAAAVLALAGFALSCAGLIPREMEYHVRLEPLLPEGRGDYFVDPDGIILVLAYTGGGNVGVGAHWGGGVGAAAYLAARGMPE